MKCDECRLRGRSTNGSGPGLQFSRKRAEDRGGARRLDNAVGYRATAIPSPFAM
jgi:hypothetical protein